MTKMYIIRYQKRKNKLVTLRQNKEEQRERYAHNTANLKNKIKTLNKEKMHFYVQGVKIK